MIKSKRSVSQFLKEYIMYIVLVVLFVVFAVINGRSFLNTSNVINILNQNVYRVIVGVGIAFIMLGGALDLSVGYQIATCSVVMGLLAQQGVNSILIIIVGIASGVLISAVNGAIYARLKVFPFMITLATQYILYGAAMQMSNSKTIKGFDSTFLWFGKTYIKIGSINFPIAILVMVLMVCIGAFILNKTYFGRNVYALGSNPDAVALSGVSVAKMRVLIFAVAGLFIGIGAFMNAAKMSTVSGNSGVGAEFTVMAGAMLGGIKMGGGGGKMSNMVVGVFVIGILDNGMNIMNVPNTYKNIALGIILLAAITIDTLQTESAAKRAKMVAGQAPAVEEKVTAGE